MSFYVYLPSNTKHINDKFIKDNDGTKSLNTTSNFTIHFSETKEFKVPYEVAVVDVMYKHSWKIPIGKLTINFRSDLVKKTNKSNESIINLSAQQQKVKFSNEFELPDSDLFTEFDLFIYDGEDIEKFFERLYDEIQERYIQILYNNRYLMYMERKKRIKNYKLINEIDAEKPYSKTGNNKILIDILKSEYTMFSLPSFFYDETKGLSVHLVNKGVEFKLTGNICKWLDIESKFFTKTSSDPNNSLIISSKKFYMKNLFITQTLFIYTDIISEQIVGNSRSSLIRTVNVQQEYFKGEHISYDVPHFFPVNKTELNSINIDIRDETGERVMFEDSIFTLVLHFRPQKH